MEKRKHEKKRKNKNSVDSSRMMLRSPIERIFMFAYFIDTYTNTHISVRKTRETEYNGLINHDLNQISTYVRVSVDNMRKSLLNIDYR